MTAASTLPTSAANLAPIVFKKTAPPKSLCPNRSPETLATVTGCASLSEVGTDKFRCSQDFYLMSSADAALLGVAGGATMDVVVPTSDSIAVAGEEYTVEVGWGLIFRFN